MPRNLLPAALYALLATILASPARGQGTSTTTSTASTTSAPATTSPDWPVKTIFYPLQAPPHLGASIISAGENATAYAISCLSTSAASKTASSCALTAPIIVTEGASTVVYTMTYNNAEQGTSGASPATINCVLSGSPATAATCTGSSAIPGLGMVESTSVLSSSQINFAKITVTAGQSKLTSVPTGLGQNGGGSQSSSSGGVWRPAATGAAWGAMGMLGAAGVLL